jgi:hypothetical protein
MKVGVKRLSEAEWQVRVGCAWIRMDRFSIELLNMSLESAADQANGVHLLQSYLKLGLQMQELDDKGLQRLLRELDPKDVEVFLVAAKDKTFTERVLKNMGGLLVKQMEQDMSQLPQPTEDEIKQSVRRIAEKMFELEQQGEIEFFDEYTQYI